MLVQVIDEVIRYSLGEINAKIIYDYFKKRNIPLDKIPDNLEFFSIELRRLLGSGRNQILGSAPIIERTILKALCKKLGLECNFEGPVNFAEHVKNLKESYNNRNEAYSKFSLQKLEVKDCQMRKQEY
jgi:hypothetical protein